LFDYRHLKEGFEPGPWYADCAFPPCGHDCLPRGDVVDTHLSTRVRVDCAVPLGDADRVQAVRDQEGLDLLLPSDAQDSLGPIDFDVSEVIVFSTNQYAWHGCWASQCVVGVVDMADGRGFLCVADACAPGWHATVDGQPTPILPANLAFRAPACAGQQDQTERQAAHQSQGRP